MHFVQTTVSAMVCAEVEFFDTIEEAAAAALAKATARAEAEGDEVDPNVSVYLLIDDDGERTWAVRPGHDGYGVHTRVAALANIDSWLEEEYAYTTDPERATA